MDTNNFADAFNEFAPSTTEGKEAIIAAATARKQAERTPYEVNRDAAYDAVLSGVKEANATHEALDTEFYGKTIGTWSAAFDKIQADYNPEHPVNKGRPYTRGEIQDKGLLSIPGIVNLGAGLKSGISEVAGLAASSGFNSLYADEINKLDNSAITAFNKENQHKAAQDEFYKEAAGLQAQVDMGALTPEAMHTQLAERRLRLDAMALTPEESASLDAVPKAAPLSDTSNRDTLANAAWMREKAKSVPAAIDNILAGKKHYQSAEGDKLSADFEKSITGDVTALNKAKDAIQKGDYTNNDVMAGFTALGSVVYKALYEGAKNPHGAAQKISEEFFDIALARMGYLGVAADVAESFGMATKMQAESIEQFMKENGRKPTPDEFSRIQNWSYTAGAMDMASDLVVSGVGKGWGKIKAAPQRTVAEIRAAALNSTATETAANVAALAKEAQSKVLGNIAKKGTAIVGDKTLDTLTEGLTEGAQQVIEDYTSKLKDVGDLSKAASATGMGALVGAGMGPMSKVVEIPAKGVAAIATGAAGAVTAGVRAAEVASAPASEMFQQTDALHRGTGERGYEEAKKAAVEAGDVEAHADQSNRETYRPILAVDALSEINNAEATDPETKAKNIEQALQIQSDFDMEAQVRKSVLNDLEAKKKSGEALSVAERKSIRELRKLVSQDSDYGKNLDALVQGMTKTQATPDDIKQSLEDVQADADPEMVSNVLKQTFGSKSGGMDLVSFGSKLQELKDSGKLNQETATLIDSILSFSEASKKLTSNAQQGKTTADVNKDILHGGKGFRGIGSYTQSIANALQKGNDTFAGAELGKLSAFAQEQQQKAVTLRAVTDGNATPADQAYLEKLNQERVAKGLKAYDIKPGVTGWENLVSTMETEADALNKGVEMAKNLFPQYGKAAPTVKSTESPSVPPAENGAKGGVTGESNAKLTSSTAEGDQPKQKTKQTSNEPPPIDDGDITDDIEGTDNVEDIGVTVKPEPKAKAETPPKKKSWVMGKVDLKRAAEVIKVKNKEGKNHTNRGDLARVAFEAFSSAHDIKDDQGRWGFQVADEKGVIAIKDMEMAKLFLNNETVGHGKKDPFVKALQKAITEHEASSVSKKTESETQTDLSSTNETQTKQEKPLAFAGGELFASSANMPEWMSGIAQSYHKLLGLQSKVYFTTLADAIADAPRFTAEPNFQRAIDSMASPTAHGAFVSLSDGTRLIITRGLGKKSRIIENVAHELGHALQRESWEQLSDDLKDQIETEFEIWRATQPSSLRDFYKSKKAVSGAKDAVRKIDQYFGDYDRQFSELDPKFQEYLLSFHEWYADQVARWAVSSEMPVTEVEKYFKKIADVLRKLYTTIAGKNYLPSEVMKSYLDGLAEVNAMSFDFQDKPQSTTENSHGKSTEEKGQEKGRLLNEQLTQPNPNENVDPKDYRTFNVFRAFASIKKKETPSLVVRFGNLFQTLKEHAANHSLGSLVPGGKFDTKSESLVQSMTEFAGRFAPKVAESFQPTKNAEFLYKDPIQYLANDGQLPPVVVNAITTACYQWLATRGQETLFNDEDTLRKMLGFKKGTDVSKAYGLMKEIGLHQDILAETLGQEIYRLLEVKIAKDAPANFEQMLIRSLGLQAIGAMEYSKDLVMTQIYTGESTGNADTNGQYGLEALKANIKNILKSEQANDFALSLNDDSFIAPQDGRPDLSGRMRSNFYRIAASDTRDAHKYLQPKAELDTIAKLWKEARQTYDALFPGQERGLDYSWQPLNDDPTQEAKLKKTGQSATAEQTANTTRNNNEGHVLDQATAAPFFALDQQSQLDVAGFVDPMDEHIDDREGVADTNKGLLRQLDQVADWMVDAMNNGGLSTVFYIPTEFYRNMRMGQRGSINLQGSKIHRYLFGMPKWKSTIKLGYNKTNKLTASELRFFEAIGLGLGVEASKKGGLTKAVKLVQAQLTSDKAIMAAVDVLRQNADLTMESGFTFTPEQSAAIVAGVKAGGEKVKTFKALVEYARYLNAREAGDKNFTTTIATEIDGMSNGPILMKMQMLFNITRSNLATLRNGGLRFTDSQSDAGEHLDNEAQMDTYEAGGLAWSEALEEHIATLAAELNGLDATSGRALQLKQELSRINAAKRLFGEFNNEKGFAVKTVRKLIKYRIVASEYGAGADSVKGELTKSMTNDTIRKALKDISKMPVSTQDERDALYAKLKALEYDVRVLANIEWKAEKAKDAFSVPAAEVIFPKNGSFNKEAILSLRVPSESLKNIHDHMYKNHGDALIKAIESLFGEVKEARETFNRGFAIVTSIYNTVRAHEVEKRKQELIAAGQLAVVLEETVKRKVNGKAVNERLTTYADLSAEEYAAIDAKLADMLPTVGTPFGGKLDMAKKSKDKIYDFGKQIVQKYGPVGSPKGKFPSEKKGYLTDPAILQIPGVSPLVMSIIMLDATISNRTQGDGLSILNCHDGFYAGLDNVEEVNQALNRNMYEMMRDFNLAQTMYESVDASIRAFNSYMIPYTQAGDQEALAAIDHALDMNFAENFITVSKNGLEKFTGAYDAMDQTLDAMKQMAQVATENKAELLLNLKNLNQYYYPNGGHDVTDQLALSDEHDLENLDANSEEDVRKRAADLAAKREANKETVGTLIANYVAAIQKAGGSRFRPGWYTWKKGDWSASTSSRKVGLAAFSPKSSDVDVSFDENDYDAAIQIDRGNAVSTYHRIKNLGTAQDSATHESHLERILHELISKVFNPADLFLRTDANKETAGAFQTGAAKDKVFISSQVSGVLAQGIQMSTGEVYVHELVHAVIHSGLKASPRLRSQVNTLYQVAREKLNVNGEGYKLFLSDPALNVLDPANRFEVEAAKARWEYIFGDKIQVTKDTRVDSATGLSQTKEYAHHLDEFMAFGLTNANFIGALRAIGVESYKGKLFNGASWKGLRGNNIQEFMVNILNRITDMFMHNFTKRVPAADMAAELEVLAHRLSDIDSNHKTMAYAATALKKLDVHQKKMAAFVNGQVKGAFSSLDQKLGVSRTVSAANAAMLNQNSAFGQMLRDYRAKIDGFNYGFLQATATSIKGLTDRVEVLHQLLNTRNLIIDQARETATMKVKNALNNLWPRPLQSHEKKAILKAGIKTDLAALRGHFSMDSIKGMLDTSPAAQGQLTVLEQAIERINRQLVANTALRPYRHFYQKQAQSLGYMMVHCRSLETVTLLNARLIAGMHGSSNEGRLTEDHIAEAEVLVDQLASLYAIQNTAGDYRDTLVALMNEDMNAVEQTIQAHADLQADARKTLFNDNPFKIIKGYTKDITNPQVKITTAPLSEEARLLEQGYVKCDDPLPRDARDPDQTPMYLYISRTGSANDLKSGIASFTGNRAKGVNSMQNTLKQGGNPLTGVLNNARLLASKKADLDAQFRSPMQPYTQNTPVFNHMIPQVDDNGRIVKYRYMMSESVKDGLLEKHNEYDAVLGAMAGTIPDKQGTKTINKELISALKDLYDKEYATRTTAYIEIGPFAGTQRGQDIYHMLPAAAKAEIDSVWGSQTMFVAKDVVDLAFGTRKYSILEAFSKDPADRNSLEKIIVDFSRGFFQDKTITRIKQVEDIVQGMVKVAKNNMIVRSFTTSLNNHVSNLMYCKGKGVGWVDIIRWKREATVGVLRYQADKKVLDELEMKLRMSSGRKASATLSQQTIDATSKQLEIKIRELKNEIALNPVTNLMDAGLMQSIVDDIDTGAVQSPYKSDLEKKMDSVTAKLPERLVNLGKISFLGEDTQGYKILANAVKMTDFVGRYIMYQHYMQSAPTDRAGRDEAHRKAIAQVIYEFVNFNLPDHRMVDYANQMGMLWFSRYALRVLKPFAEMVKDKPFEAITSFTLAHTLGLSNLAGSILFLGKNPLDLIGNPLTAFMTSSDDAITLQAAESLYDSLF